MQHLPRLIDGNVMTRAGILFIAEYRIALFCKVSANLVRATGFNAQSQDRSLPVLSKILTRVVAM